MKKLLALILVLVLCLPAMALADVLADDWQDASMEELLDAQQNISNRISELRAAAAADVERVELSGTGTAGIASGLVAQSLNLSNGTLQTRADDHGTNELSPCSPST